MADRPAALQSGASTRLPGEAGIWAFIFGDLIVFSLFFGAFMYARSADPVLFSQSQGALSQSLGVLNTLLMLTSSWFVALAVGAARKGFRRAPTVLLLLAFGCGAGFGVVKFIEYSAKFAADIYPVTNNFYMYYFVFTGIHFFHVLIGMGLLGYFSYAWAVGGQTRGDRKIESLECGALFWHVVDLLWIVLFGLLYLVR